MNILQAANLALAFLLELCALASFAYWGFNASDSTVVRIVLGIGTPVLAAVVWGIFAAPRSARRLRGDAYLAFKVVFFALAVLALIVSGQVNLALVFAVVFIINTALAYLWHQEEAAA